MRTVGYWASQEQYSMQDLIKFTIEAEKGGFTSTMTSDHFHPWWNDGGFGNFTWIWLAAAAERTKKMRFVTGVTSPIYRYNPAIIAQAFASLAILYPHRISLGLGSGEAMNEVSVGFEWPSSRTRLERTIEAIEIIKILWEKEQQPQSNRETSLTSDKKFIKNGFLNYNGQYFKTKSAKLYSLPSYPIPLYMAASGPKATAAAATLTNGLITLSNPNNSKEVFYKFDEAAVAAGKDPNKLEKIGKPRISYSEDYDEAFKSINFWRASEIMNVFDTAINDPRKLQQKALEEVSDEELKKSTLIVTSVEDLIKPLEEYFKCGFTQIYIHSTSPDELDFVQQFCKKVLPHFKEEKQQ